MFHFNHSGNMDETKHFLSKNKILEIELDNLWSAYNGLNDLIPQEIGFTTPDGKFVRGRMGSGNTLPYSESIFEIHCSYELASLSFYKQAMISLRSALELGLLSVYFDKNDDSQKTIPDWYNSNMDTPFKKNIVKGILQIENITKFCTQSDLEKRINQVFEDLSHYNHSKGLSYSAMVLNKANFTRFNEDAFLKWTVYFKRVIQILVIIHILKYPIAMQDTPMFKKFGLNGPMSGFIDDSERYFIKAVLSEEDIKIIQEISDSDENAKTQAEWVNSHRDLTNEEIEKQLKEWEELMEQMKPKNSTDKD